MYYVDVYPRVYTHTCAHAHTHTHAHTHIHIETHMHKCMNTHLLANLICFLFLQMHEETMVNRAWGRKGAPWEFNLRDINRWCDLLLANQVCIDSTVNIHHDITILVGWA